MKTKWRPNWDSSETQWRPSEDQVKIFQSERNRFESIKLSWEKSPENHSHCETEISNRRSVWPMVSFWQPAKLVGPGSSARDANEIAIADQDSGCISEMLKELLLQGIGEHCMKSIVWRALKRTARRTLAKEETGRHWENTTQATISIETFRASPWCCASRTKGTHTNRGTAADCLSEECGESVMNIVVKKWFPFSKLFLSGRLLIPGDSAGVPSEFSGFSRIWNPECGAVKHCETQSGRCLPGWALEGHFR